MKLNLVPFETDANDACRASPLALKLTVTSGVRTCDIAAYPACIAIVLLLKVPECTQGTSDARVVNRHHLLRALRKAPAVKPPPRYFPKTFISGLSPSSWPRPCGVSRDVMTSSPG